MTTLDEIRTMERPWITAEQAADVLGSNPQYIRMQGRANPARLGFPVICVGNRVKIPRLPFLAVMEGRGA